VVIVDETETSVGAKVRQRQSEGNWKKAVTKGRTVRARPIFISYIILYLIEVFLFRKI